MGRVPGTTNTEQVRVLIVEDDEDDFILTRDLLLEQDRTRFAVEWASDTKAALGLIRERRHDIYLIDHRLGELTGLDLVRRAFDDGAQHAPVIVLTGYDDFEVDVEASMLGVTDFLIKGRLDSALLERSIRYAIRHEAMLSELRTAQDRYALAVKGANDGIWDWDLLKQEVYFGPRWKAILGYGDEEIGTTPEEWFDRVRPDDLGHLRASLDAHLGGQTPHFESEHRIRHADGSYRWVLSRGVAVRDAEDRATRLAGSMSDITARKGAEQRLRHDALHDSLTGLPNRTLFLDHLELSLSRAKRDPGYRCGVLFLDVNRFKLVNDGFSHAVGDQLLIALGERLKAELRPGDTIARFGGDEFTVLLHDIRSADDAVEVAERLQRVVAEPFMTEGRNLILGVSIGVAVSDPACDAAELIRDADIAMYEAKREQDAATAIFNSSMRNRMIGELQLETELRDVIEQKRLRVFYQPIVELESAAIQGLEALARWPEEAEQEVSPIEFIPVAENTGLIRPLGRLVLQEACSQMATWRSAGLVDDEVTISSTSRPASSAPGPARRRRAGARRERLAGRAAAVGDHRARDHARPEPDADGAGGAGRARGEGRDRRLRQRLLVAHLPQSLRGQHAEDRPLLCRLHVRRRRQRRNRPRDSRPRRQPEPGRDCRGGRDRGSAADPAVIRRPLRAGIPVRAAALGRGVKSMLASRLPRAAGVAAAS